MEEYTGWNHRLNEHFRSARGVWFKPILILLDRAGLTANKITNLRLVFAFIFIYWFFQEQFWSSIFMLFILLLDTVDGALARYQNKASDRGKFLDMVVDHIVYVITVFAMGALGADVVLVILNLAIIPLVYLLGVIHKGEGVPSDWIIKPYPRLSYLRLFPVAGFFIATLLRYNVMDLALAISTVWAMILAVSYFIIIQLRWQRIDIEKSS